MNFILNIILTSLAATYALWCFYLAVMNLKRAKDSNKLTRTAAILGAPILYAGYALDIAVNVTVMTVVLLELPKEFTVSSRFTRHSGNAGYRGAIARWAAIHLLDPYDPDGKHI